MKVCDNWVIYSGNATKPIQCSSTSKQWQTKANWAMVYVRFN